MSKTRVESLVKSINIINDKMYSDTKKTTVILLAEIAGSLAVIADCMTEKKEGDAE